MMARRTLLKILAASGGAVAAKGMIPEQWGRPLIEVGYLPAHAQTSPVTNSAPSFTTNPPTGVSSGGAYSYSIATDDANAGDTWSITATTPLPSWLSLTDNGDGTGTLSGTPGSGDVGSHSVTLQMEDSGGLTDTQSFTIVVSLTNSAPSFTTSGGTVATCGSAYIYNIATDDPDAGDTRTITATTPLPSWLSLTDNGDGTGTLSGTPGSGDVGNHSVTLQVQDAGGLTDTQSFTIAVSAVNKVLAYVANLTSSNVSVIDTATDTVITTVSVGSFPQGVAVTPDGSKVYVANSNSDDVSVIDTATNTVSPTTISVGTGPQGVAVTPDGSKVYVANLTSSNVSVIDTATDTVITTVGVGTRPRGVAVTPDGSKVYVANFLSNNVSVIDTATDTVSTTVNVGPDPLGVAVTGSKVYVANLTSSNVSVIDTATDTVIVTVNLGLLGTGPQGVAVTPDGSKVYVTIFGGRVSVIDTATDTVSPTTISVGTGPIGVAVTPDGSKVYVANSNSNDVSVIDTAMDTVSPTTISVGGGPISLGNFIGTVPSC